MRWKKTFNPKGNLSINVYITLLAVIKFSLIVAIVWSAYKFDWEVLLVSSLTLILTYIPTVFKKNYKIPLEFEVLIVLFIYATLFLGGVQKFYKTIWWWDSLLHLGSGIGLGFVGFIILYMLRQEKKLKADPFIIALFAFLFAVGIGAVWEIYEFSVDNIFGWNMQDSGLRDTMGDLIVDSIGALIASISGYFYLKGREGFFIRRAINKFAIENPRLFREHLINSRKKRKEKRQQNKLKKRKK